jgi:hypothetical protein
MSNQRKRIYRNPIRRPVILSVIIVGLLVGARWYREVRVNHRQNDLSSNLRQTKSDIVGLKAEIEELKARTVALLTEDALLQAIAAKDIKMENIDRSKVHTIPTLGSLDRMAMNSTTE